MNLIDKREQYTQAKKECRSLDLESFLIKPVQRVCKYPLLLRELERATETDHVDYEDIAAAFEQIQSSVNSINETKVSLLFVAAERGRVLTYGTARH